MSVLVFLMFPTQRYNSINTSDWNANVNVNANANNERGDYAYSRLQQQQGRRRRRQIIQQQQQQTTRRAEGLLERMWQDHAVKPRNVGIFLQQRIKYSINKRQRIQQQQGGGGRMRNNNKIDIKDNNDDDDDDDDGDWIIVGIERLSTSPATMMKTTKNRKIYVPEEELQDQQDILTNSEDYEDDCRFPPECVPIHEWQHTVHPTCNSIHETDLNNFYGQYDTFGNINKGDDDDSEEDEAIMTEMVKLISTQGYRRDVWLTRELHSGNATFVLKTIKPEWGFDLSNFNRHRRDAIVMERLTSSPHVMDIYGYCSTTALHELSRGPDLMEQIMEQIMLKDTEEAREAETEREQQHAEKEEPGAVRQRREFNLEYKVQIAHQVAQSLVDVHFTDGPDLLPTIVNADISPDQYLYMGDGKFKLNDFNRGHLLKKYPKTGELCGFTLEFNGGRARSPEEYRYEQETDKADVYGMGMLFYILLTETFPFEEVSDEEEVQELVKLGKRPDLSPDKNSAIVKQVQKNDIQRRQRQQRQGSNSRPNEVSSVVDSSESLSSSYLVDLLVQTIEMCWIHNPKERPSAIQVERFLREGMEKLGVKVIYYEG